MPRQYTGKVSVGRSEIKKSNGVIYVYERTSWYNREKHATESKRRLLGIKDPETGEIVQTRPRKVKEISNDHDADQGVLVTRKENAMISILSYLSEASGVTHEVNTAMGHNRGLRDKTLTLAWYAFATEGRAWTRAANWTEAFRSELPYHYGPITEDIYQDLFRELGKRADLKWAVFQQRAKQLGDGELIALDSTTVSTRTQTIHNAQKAADKDKLIRNVYKIVYLYSITARQMVAYALIPGHIPDCSTVDAALTQLDVLELSKDIEVVQDNGYSTDEDLGEYFHRRRHFITRLEGNRSWIAKEVDKAVKEISDGAEGTSVIHCDPEFGGKAISVRHCFPYKRKYASQKKQKKAGETEYLSANVNVFIYFSSKKKGEEDLKFRTQFEQVRMDAIRGAYLDQEAQSFLKKYCEVINESDGTVANVVFRQDEYSKKMKYHGVLVIIADRETSIEQALIKFRSREKIEEGIEGHKGHTGGNTTKPGSTDESLDGELFVEFLANSMRECFRSRLRSMNATLGVPIGVRDHDLKANLEMETKVKNWIRKKSMVYLLEYFERKETIVLRSGKKRYQFGSLKTKRDSLFLEKLGAIEETSCSAE